MKSVQSARAPINEPCVLHGELSLFVPDLSLGLAPVLNGAVVLAASLFLKFVGTLGNLRS